MAVCLQRAGRKAADVLQRRVQQRGRGSSSEWSVHAGWPQTRRSSQVRSGVSESAHANHGSAWRPSNVQGPPAVAADARSRATLGTGGRDGSTSSTPPWHWARLTTHSAKGLPNVAPPHVRSVRGQRMSPAVLSDTGKCLFHAEGWHLFQLPH